MSRREIDLALVKYMYDKFGIIEEENPFDYMREHMSYSEKIEPGQTMYFKGACNALINDKSEISKEQLRGYDSNINEYLKNINSHREEDIELRYYQYLSVLFSEFYFDMLESDREGFRDDLNDYIFDVTGLLGIDSNQEINKIAYWMATGSGKTYVSHINYHQFINYFGRDEVDNIIMVAPKEQVAKQHVDEYKRNGINAGRINNGGDHDVMVTDFGKLDINESGPKTVDVSEYADKNLVFVDEGHKGLGSIGTKGSGSGWKELRDTLAGENGYTLEYSATYGSSIKKEAGFQEYSSSIIFDYPYGRFHSDKYGKDYKILNLNGTSELDEQWVEERDKWLLMNILNYYEKLMIFEDNPSIADEYNIRKPLSVFVGGRVNVVKDGEDITDIEKVIKVMCRCISDKEWAVNIIRDIIEGRTEESGVFDDSFSIIKKKFRDSEDNYSKFAEDIYYDLINRLFDSDGEDRIEINRLKNGEGEIGLKSSSSGEYFGLITIGDSKDFVDMVEERGYENVEVNEIDIFSEVLFNSIGEEKSSLRFLIGSKKFAEGWDSTRPTNMGLLNLGRSKGPAIIQMFGRGVRVEGKNHDGKRDSIAVDNKVTLLQKLHVFGVRASYIEEFKDSLEEERVEVDAKEESVKVSRDNLEVKDKFYRPITLTESEDITVSELSNNLESMYEPSLNLVYSIEEIGGDSEQVEKVELNSEKVQISSDLSIKGESVSINKLDFNSIYWDVVRRKNDKGMNSIIVTKRDVEEIIKDDMYSLYCDRKRLELNSMENLDEVEDLCVEICEEFIDNVYSEIVKKTEEEKIELKKVDEEWLNRIVPDSFTITYNENSRIDEIISGDDNEYSDFISEVKKHYYNPIWGVSETDKDVIDVHPEGLNRGEINFVNSVSSYLEEEKSYIEEALILRNPSRKGVGFSSAGGYYPDFIIWVNTSERQHVIFADPKGIARKNKEKEKKVRFGKEIREYSKNVKEEVELHSYIVGRLDKTKNNNNRNKIDIINEWSEWLKEEGYEGEGEKLLNNANIYLQETSKDQTGEAIIRDAVDKI